MTYSLIELRGMISNVAIENPAHNRVIKIIDGLIEKYGCLARISWDDFKELAYGQKERKAV